MRTLRTNSKGNDVITLQHLLAKYGFSVSPDGIFSNSTKQAVIEFQRENQLDADGIVGYRSWETLFFAKRDNNQSLTEDDFKLTAQLLDCEPAALMAIQEVETGKCGGFFELGKPAILFEGHIFWSQLKKRGIDPNKYVVGNESILYPKWSKSHYKGGIAEYDRLEQARRIHSEAADSSASWGMFQIMGFNYVVCGEKSVADFVNMMHKSELHQLLLSARFIKSGGMLPALQQKKWTEFAKRYNGSQYAQNEYDKKIVTAYEKFVLML